MRRLALCLFVGIFINLGNLALGPTYGHAGTPARNIILFIGDGMGFEHVRAAGLFAHGRSGSLGFERFPYRAKVTTYSASHDITDSAAAATAMATGVKVRNGVISVALPGDGKPLTTLLERHAAQGKRVGLVTTTRLTHATPAAFGAHVPRRDDEAEIAKQYLTRSRPHVLLGGAYEGLTPQSAARAGYTVATDAARLKAIAGASGRVAGLFGNGHLPYEFDGLGDLPNLAEMTAAALRMLGRRRLGFFLMIEGGRIDHASHRSDIERTVRETLAFAEAVRVAVDWAKHRAGTLILVTADHETGGMSIVEERVAGLTPRVAWSTSGHTDRPVPLYALGVGAARVSGTMDNVDIFDLAGGRD